MYNKYRVKERKAKRLKVKNYDEQRRNQNGRRYCKDK